MIEVINRAIQTFRGLAVAILSDRWVASIASLLVGSVAASLWPWAVGWGALILLAGFVGRRIAELRRERQCATDYTAFELALRQPDPDALARMHAANEHFLVFNRVIEILPHYRLSSRTRFASLGWVPDEIRVGFNHEYFDASEILARVGGRKEFEPPGGRKFCLSSRSLAGTDEALSLSLRESDYFTVRSVCSSLPFELRTEFGSLDPAQNRIPHSLCLHFIVRCIDGSVLCLQNDMRKAYGGGMWSVSGEEQLKDSDLKEQFPLVALFNRALLEEVFGLCDEDVPLDSRWDRVKAFVHSTRIWSLFVVEHLNNFSLLGVCQLSVDPSALGNKIRAFIDDGSAARDLEGKLHFISKENLEHLLIVGDTTATGLFSGRTETVFGEALHWTSRYRVFRLLRALNGGPLIPPKSGW